jgi:hypothetical protein
MLRSEFTQACKVMHCSNLCIASKILIIQQCNFTQTWIIHLPRSTRSNSNQIDQLFAPRPFKPSRCVHRQNLTGGDWRKICVIKSPYGTCSFIANNWYHILLLLIAWGKMSIDTYVNFLELYVVNLNRYRPLNSAYFSGAPVYRTRMWVVALPVAIATVVCVWTGEITCCRTLRRCKTCNIAEWVKTTTEQWVLWY